jgi:hypothetical protein
MKYLGFIEVFTLQWYTIGASGIALGAYGAHGLVKVVGDNPTKIKVGCFSYVR